MAVEVLLVSSRLDLPTDRLCNHLARQGVSFLRCNREDLADFTFVLNPTKPELHCRYGEAKWIVDNSLKSVWWRQPTFRRIAQATVPTQEEQLDESQWSAFVRGLTIFENARWFNDPAATFRSESKMYQLRAAHDVGFAVPETRITNDASAPIHSTIGHRIALKSIDTLYLVDGSMQAFGYTQLVDWNDCANENFHLLPAMCQEIIHDKIDLRVTVVGRQLWCDAVLVDSNGVEGDWRLSKQASLSYEEHELPTTVVACIHRLMDKLQLNYGAIDLALSEGTYWFIEINPTGEWGWLDRPGRGLSEGIIRELSN